MRITSVARDGAGSSFDLTLALSQVETNVPLGAEVFRVDSPRAARADHARRAYDMRVRAFAKINLSLRVLGHAQPTGTMSCGRSFSRSRCTTR